MKTYKIIRHFENGERAQINEGLTLEEAQAHCKDKQTSSRTCSTKTAEKFPGNWFDGYDVE